MPHLDLLTSAIPNRIGDSDDLLQSTLEIVRKHLGMDVAYLSEFIDGRAVFRRVDAPGLEELAKVGDSHNLADVYCGHVLEGRLPELIADTADNALARSMPITHQIPIGAHMSIPILRSDGSAYGMICCLSRDPNPTLNDRDLETMRVFADLATRHINRELAENEQRAEQRHRIESVLARGAFSPVYQPIFDLGKMTPAGYEALTRFTDEPIRTPDVWFNEAAEVGLAEALEIAALERALARLADLPNDQYLSVNASPDTIVSAAFAALMDDLPLYRILLEITEHAQVNDYATLLQALEPLRRRGLKLAIDDAGAGYSSLRHIVQLSPDVVKLDMSLTHDVDSDAARRALVGALMFYARETSAQVIAEGIETQNELDTLKLLGVRKGQGFFLGRPAAALLDPVSAVAFRRGA
ncbi:sensor domain-containing phosphodiesterase [Hyphomonas johnsonii]|uniref:Diguanylate phosphodiesterase n=1 Tax=Hyphomonas johnsonii MHS-2 TaxID=1280950 RepID=A0A059FQK7_9PROT|nr:EAL domain-containing protein [Hyphomonas johnsonii]KCZ92934.1 diguanylate phosphodiesterase [Hyphomonas johnsonii MHS-2]